MNIKSDLTKIDRCRVCGSKNVLTELFNKKFFLSNLDTLVDMSYGVCVDCQYIFQSDYVGDDFLNHYYQNSPMFRKSFPSVYESDQFKRQADFLTRHVEFGKEKITCLEIGAHTGHFLLHLQENFDCVTYFDELSEEAVKILSEHSELHNYRNCKDIKVNLIVLRHVLEHIHDLKSFINYLDDSLTPGGYLFIEVPDWGTFDDNTDTFIFEHLSQFNSTSLIDMMRKNGYHCHALEKSIHPDDPATPNRVMRFIFKKSVAPNFGSVEFAKFFQSFKEERYEYANKKLNRIYKEIGEKKTIAFYPASNLSFSAVLETEIEKFNLIGYFDSDKKKHGKSFLGYQVFPAESLVKKEPDYIFIFTQAYEPEIRDSFKKMNIKSTIYSITDILASDYE